MKRWSKKLGFGNTRNQSIQSPWTKYDSRLLEGVENEELIQVKSAMRKPDVSCLKQDSNGIRALHLACMKGLGGCLKIMLKAEKPDLTTMDANGRIPLHLAARSGSEDCVKYLLHYKSPVDIQDNSSMSPLHYAVSGGHETPTYLLLRSGAPVNPKDKEGRTPLILASQGNNTDIVTLLCEAGALVNIQDNAGRTALMFASENGIADIVDMLLSIGADPEIKDLAGNTAETLATKAEKNEIVEILKNSKTNGNSIENGGIVNGHTNKVCEWDNMSEMDNSTAMDDIITMNSSSSYDERSLQESLSECSPRSTYQTELGKFENSTMFKELHCLKTELRTETLKRTKAEDEIRMLRMQLENGQANDEDSAVVFSDGDSEDILFAIEKNIPSPFRNTSEDVEDSPLVSALRGEVYALESQIERLKKELEDARKSEDGKITKIPLTVYRTLKETHEELKRKTAQENENIKTELGNSNEKVDRLSQESQSLKRKIEYYKELYEKGDKSEKIRELNEQIVSLKLQISHCHQLENEHETLKNDYDILEQRLEEEKSKIVHENLSKKKVTDLDQNVFAEQERQKISRYRNVLLSLFQGELSSDLEEILSKITELRRSETVPQ